MKKVENLPSPPHSKSSGDVAHELTKFALNCIPMVGSGASQAFELAVAAPAQNRIQKWHEQLEQTINALVSNFEDLTPAALGQNEAFVTAVIHTSQAAMLTEKEEKRRLLAAAVYNTGSGLVLDEFLRNTFFNLLEKYTPAHVEMLKKLDSKEELKAAYRRRFPRWAPSLDPNVPIDRIEIEKLAPSLMEHLDYEVASEIFTDLHSDNLCNGSEGFSHSYMPIGGEVQTTLRGREFLNFVTIDAGQS